MRRQQGFVLIVSLIVMTAILIVVFGASFTSMIDRQVSSNQKGSNAAYYVAQAGINQFKTLIFKNLVDYYAVEGQGWCAPPIHGGIIDDLGQPILLPGHTSDWYPFGPGSYRVTFDIRDTYMILTSVGRVGRSQTTLQLVATAGGGPVGGWDNAILAAGTRPGAKAINGNVSVYGSVHLVKGDLDLSQTGIDLGGNAGIYNTYAGEGTSNDARDVMEELTGDREVDLCTRLKVKSGSVYLWGSSTLGDPATGRSLYSIHLGNGKVYDGKPGSNPVEITDHTASNLVSLRFPSDCADPTNCINSGYDGHDIGLPVLDTNYPNEVDAFTITGADCGWLISGGRIELPPKSVGSCGDENGSISWNGSYLEFNGVLNTGALDVLVTGDLEYSGRARIRLGTSRDDTSALFKAEKASIRPIEATYPSEHALAIESSGDVSIDATGGGGFKPFAAMMYAARNAIFGKQVLVAGAVIADSFDVGNNVPKIAYHPDVREVAEEMCLVGSFCYGGEVGPNPGILSDISIERRDTAAID